MGGVVINSSHMRSARSTLLSMEWRGKALCPGSCGELVQGTWDGINFLVPCPINLSSTAEVRLTQNAVLHGQEGYSKALEAVKRTLLHLGRPELGGELTISSVIPKGKGMASSTADIGAAIAATASALGVSLTAGELTALAVGIEPTDGTLLPGITLLDHVGGRWRLPLGGAPEGKILALDFGGQVDTLEFNSLPELSTKNSANERLTREAFHLVRRGIQEKNLVILGKGTTLSARANQSILLKPLLPELEIWGKNRGSLGVIAAHSGTVLGLIYHRDRDLSKEIAQAKIAFPTIEGHWALEFAQGGVKVVKPSAGAWREFTGSQGSIRGIGFS